MSIHLFCCLLILSISQVVSSSILPYFHSMEKQNYRSSFVKKNRSPAHEHHEVVISVQMKNLDELESKVLDRADPESPLYQEWFTYDEITDIVKNPEATNNVQDWLTKNNVDVLETLQRGDYIIARAPFSTWEKLLNCEFYAFEDLSVSRNRQEPHFVHRALEYSIPISLRDDIHAIFNTVQVPPEFHTKYNNMQEFNPDHSFKTSLRYDDQKKTFTTQASQKVVTVSFLNSLYQVPSNTGSSKLSQGVFSTKNEYFSTNDLTQFQNTYNLPIQAANVQNGHSAPNCYSANNCSEGNLDVQYIMGMAQKTTTIYWFEPSGTSTDPFILWILDVARSAHPLQTNSISYGTAEKRSYRSVVNAFNTQAMYLAGMGVTIVASSGDNATFNDVTSGNNKCCPYQSSSSGCCSAGFLATTGWDPATGWGSINFPSFAAMFNVAVTYTSPNTSTSTSGDSGLHVSFTMVIIAAVVLVVAGSILIAGLDFPFLNLSVLPSRRLNFNIIAILTLLSISSLQALQQPLSIKSLLFGNDKPRFRAPVPVDNAVFVNRDKELIDTWRVLIKNFEEGKRDKKVLPVGCQMYGMGKTKFGEKLACFKHDVYAMGLFNSLPQSPGKEALATCIFVSIDMTEILHTVKRFHSQHGNTTSLDMDALLKYVVMANFITQHLDVTMVDDDLLLKLTKVPIPMLLLDLRSLCGGRSLFLHFDEIGVMDQWDIYFSNHQFPDDPIYRSLCPYYSWWNEMVNFMSNQAFVFCSGKSLNVQLLGRQMFPNSSPSLIERIYLKPFKVGNIEDIIIREQQQQHLNLTSIEVHALSVWIHGITSGIPRSVVYTWKYLLESSRLDSLLNMLSTNELPNKYEDKVSRLVLNYLRESPSTNTVPSLNLISPHMRETFFKLITMASREQIISSSKKINGFLVRELVDLFGMIATKPIVENPSLNDDDEEEEDPIQLIMPLLWRRFLEIPALGMIITDSLNEIDKGKHFENSLIRPLLEIDQQPIRLEKFMPFLSSWKYGDSILPPTILRGLPRMPSCPKKQHRILSQYSLLISNETLLLIPADQSSTPDMMLLGKTVKGRKQILIGLQAKNNNPNFHGNSFGMPDLIRELLKFEPMRHSMRCNALFIVANTGTYTRDLTPYCGEIIKANKIFTKPNSTAASVYKQDKLEILLLTFSQIEEYIGPARMAESRAIWDNETKKKEFYNTYST